MGSIVAGPQKELVEFFVWWVLPDYTQRVRLGKDPVTEAFSSSLNIKKDRKPTTTDAFIFPPWAGWSLPKPTLSQGGCLRASAQWPPASDGRFLSGSAETMSLQSGWHQASLCKGCPQHWCHPAQLCRCQWRPLPSQSAGLAETGAGEGGCAQSGANARVISGQIRLFWSWENTKTCARRAGKNSSVARDRTRVLFTDQVGSEEGIFCLGSENPKSSKVALPAVTHHRTSSK